MENLTKVLERLNEHHVRYVLVGGLAAVVHGATLVTRDVDVCLDFTRANLEKLEAALKDLHSVHRMTPQRLPFSVAGQETADWKNLYLATDFGVLDCLGEIPGIGRFHDAERRSVVLQLPIGPCCVLKLDALIESKDALRRTQDKLVLMQLRAIAERKSNKAQ